MRSHNVFSFEVLLPFLQWILLFLYGNTPLQFGSPISSSIHPNGSIRRHQHRKPFVSLYKSTVLLRWGWTPSAQQDNDGYVVFLTAQWRVIFKRDAYWCNCSICPILITSPLDFIPQSCILSSIENLSVVSSLICLQHFVLLARRSLDNRSCRPHGPGNPNGDE